MGAHAVSLGDRLFRPRRVRRFEWQLDDGAATTVYVATYTRRSTRVRVVALDRPEPLHRWARRAGVTEALSGGFYVDGGTPLGELHSGGHVHMTIPFDPPFDTKAPCLSIAGGHAQIAPRGVLPSSARGELLQAGPLLVVGGTPIAAAADERHPRAAFGIARDRYLAVVADGRSIRDAGLMLAELARLMAELGADTAMNLCGGASASLVSGGSLHNRPRDDNGVSLLGGRPVASAIVFER
jgi:hypothetical protein